MRATSWTADDLPALSGRTAVVTGANSGIGWHTAAELGRHGASVTLACRNTDLAEQAAARMREAGAIDVRVEALDLSSLASVKEFADRWSGPLDLLVNNAGVMTPPRYRQTADGFELQFGTNHLGHYALTGRLLPALLEAPAPRVVAVASIAHFRGKADVLDGNPRERYRPEPAYANSKLANVLFALELQRRAAAHGTALTSTAAHPGVSATNLVTSTQGMGAIPGVRLLAPPVLRLLFQSAAAGAMPSLYAATEAEPGSYSGPQSLRETRGRVGPARLNPLARDERLAGQLWDLSEELTKVVYPWP
jgi:NAD(P)-dependent dehydrogenase (short-subunit alcohol dehydrogenase family)